MEYKKVRSDAEAYMSYVKINTQVTTLKSRLQATLVDRPQA